MSRLNLSKKQMPTIRINRQLQDRCYFITFTVLDWVNVFISKKYFEEIVKILKFYQKSINLRIYGYVIMKNHIHIIAQCSDMIYFVKNFKSYSTKVIKNLLFSDGRTDIIKKLCSSDARKGVNDFQLWFTNNWPKICEEEAYFNQKLDYIHENPTRALYVEKEEDWSYSSARNYYLDDHSVIKVDTGCELD
jgi:putative transposase